MSRRLHAACCFTALIFCGSLAEGQESKQEKSPLEALKEEYAQAEAAWNKQYSGQRGTPTPLLIERYEAWPAWLFIPRIVEFASDHVGSPEEFEALKWFVEMSRAVGSSDALYFEEDERVMAALRERYLNDTRITGLFRDCSYYLTPAREAFLRDCVDKGAVRIIRGMACYYLAEHLQNKATFGPLMLGAPPGGDEFQLHVAGRRSPAFTNYLAALDAGQAREQAKATYQRVIDEFDDIISLEATPLLPGKPRLGPNVRFRLGQLTAPAPGEPAPELSGKDLTGNELKLSGYHGKIVVLYFWASWNRPNLDSIGHLQDLAAKYRSRDDFCIVGVNYDRQKKRAEQAVKDREIAWPSWWAAELDETMLGRWCPADSRLGALPMIVVVDSDGNLRHHANDDATLDNAIEQLLPKPLKGNADITK